MNEKISWVWYYYKQGILYVLGRLEYISEVSKDIAQVFFAAFAIESFVKNPINWGLVGWGIVLSGVFWSVGIMSFRKRK